MLSAYLFLIRKLVFRRRSSPAIILVLLLVVLSSCKKNNVDYGTSATVQIFNGIDDNVHLIANLSGSHPIQYNRALYLKNKSYVLSNTIFVNKFPQPIALYGSLDTLAKDQSLVSLNMDVKSGGIYSLFVFGPKDAADYLLHKDIIPSSKNDSLTYFRVVNLSAGQHISVNLKGEPEGSLISTVPFKEITGFIPLKADKSVSKYEFEFRDETTGDLLASYVVEGINGYSSGVANSWFNKTSSFVFSGQKNGIGANQQKITLVKSQL